MIIWQKEWEEVHMKFNPQMFMQMMMQRDPGLMQRFQQFQQMMQQYNTFKTNLMQNPQLQEQAMKEAMQKMGMKTE